MAIDFDNLPKEAQEAILNKPLAKPPPGAVSHVGQPPEVNVMIVSLATASLFVITVVFLLRAYSKIFCTKKLRLADLFGFIAFGACVVQSYTVIQMGIYPGKNMHTWDMTVRDLEPYYKNFNLLRAFYCIDLAFCKNAILFEWIHIFVPLPQRTGFFWLCTALIIANTALYTAAIVANYIVVIPLEALWKPWIDARHLINRQAADTAVIAFNLVCDILILVIPQRVIWKLRLHRRRKIGLSILFGLGVLTCICAGGRVYSVAKLNWNYDTIYGVPGVTLWGVGESTFAMMVFCIPAVPKIFSAKEPGPITRMNKRLRSWIQLTFSSSRTASQSGNTSQQMWPAADTSKFYRKMMEGDSDMALAEANSGEKDRLGRKMKEERITKTTELFTRADAADENEMAAVRDQAEFQQHPWMGGSGPRS